MIRDASDGSGVPLGLEAEPEPEIGFWRAFGLTEDDDLAASARGVLQVHGLQLGDETRGTFGGAVGKCET